MKKTLLMLALTASLVSVAPLSSAAVQTYQANLTGPGEVPPNVSPATGSGIVQIDDVAHTMQLDIVFSGLLGTTSAAHIHCCTVVPLTGTAGVATTVPNFPGFPVGVNAGVYNATLDLLAAGSYNPAFLTAHGGTPAGAEAALLGGIAMDEAYLNIHTTSFPGGEIRGFLSPVPEPSAWAMMLLGIAGIGFYRRRRA
jgi:hypothetical protein